MDAEIFEKKCREAHKTGADTTKLVEEFTSAAFEYRVSSWLHLTRLGVGDYEFCKFCHTLFAKLALDAFNSPVSNVKRWNQ